MYGDIRPADRVADIPNVVGDLGFAQQTVVYLRGRGFDDRSIVQCLRDGFQMDLATAETIAHQGL